MALELPQIIKELTNEGLSDTEALNISTEIMQIELLKKQLNLTFLNEEAISKVLDRVQNASDTEKSTFSILGMLSKREVQCFLLNSIYLMSFAQIADKLGISKSAVQQYIERARGKIGGYSNAS